MIHFDLHNIVTGHGVAITLTGMTIVFCGLLLISFFIYILPRFLEQMDSVVSKEKKGAVRSASVAPQITEDEVMAAISLAVHIELEQFGGDRQRITVRQPPATSIWNSAGKMRTLSM